MSAVLAEPIILDAVSHELTAGTSSLRLTLRHWLIIEALSAATGTVTSRQLAARLWPDGRRLSALFSQIHFLRQTLQAAGIPLDIETVGHKGYRLTAPVEVRRAGPAHIAIPRALLGTLETILHAHPDSEAAGRVLAAIEGA